MGSRFASQINAHAYPLASKPCLDFAELKKKLDERKSLVEAFNVYDKDGDGEVSLGDLYQTMLSNGESVTLDEVKEMLNECDLHHNGYINFEDFRKAMGSDVTEDDGAEA